MLSPKNDFQPSNLNLGTPVMLFDELLARCQSGDRQAENELIAIYFAKLADKAQQKIGQCFAPAEFGVLN